jgi:hypothetical protein
MRQLYKKMKLISSAAFLCLASLSVRATSEYETTSTYVSDVIAPTDSEPASTSSCEYDVLPTDGAVLPTDEYVLPTEAVAPSTTASCEETVYTESANDTAPSSFETMVPGEEPAQDMDLEDLDAFTEEVAAAENLNPNFEWPVSPNDTLIDPTEFDQNLYSDSVRNTISGYIFLLALVNF